MRLWRGWAVAVIRLISAIVATIGLVMVGVVQVSAMHMAPGMAMVDTTGDMPEGAPDGGLSAPGHGGCPCCDGAGLCSMANCPMHCVPFGPGASDGLNWSFGGHAGRVGSVPSIHAGLRLKPPIPPPRG